MVVYIEYVFIDNLVIDHLLISVTHLLSGKRKSHVRIAFASLFGAGAALLFPLAEEKSLALSVIFKIAVGITIPVISAKFLSFRDYFKFLGFFLSLSFAAGGAVIGVFSLLSLNPSSEISVGLMILPVYIALKIISAFVRNLFKRKHVERLKYDCTLSYKGKEVKATGFLDTGNGVYFENSPVIFSNAKLFCALIDGPDSIKGLLSVEFFTVRGKTKTHGIKTDRLVIDGGDRKYTIYGAILCIGEIGEGFDLILHPDMTEGDYDKNKICA